MLGAVAALVPAAAVVTTTEAASPKKYGRLTPDTYRHHQLIIKETEGTGKNPLAVALGRMGGLKGGRARAEKLTKEERRASAMKAAKARWKSA